jgi:hypothetical protein
MIKKEIRKKLLEVKEKKDRLIVEQTIITNRVLMIFESKENITNFNLLTESKKKKIAKSLYREIHTLHQNNLINEGFVDILKSIFGNAFTGIVETMVEPFVDSVLGGLGLTGGFKKFLVSILTTNPTKLVSAFKDCRIMTELISEGIAESMAMTAQEKLGLEGQGWSVIRNILGKTLKEQSFVSQLSDAFEGTICGVFDKLTDNAEGVLSKLNPTSATPSPTV